MVENLSRSEQKRQDILLAALAEFKDKSFAGTSMDAIAERAQASKRTVYNYFASKELLFQAVMESFWQQSKGVANQAFDANRPVAEQLEEIATAMWTLYLQSDFIEKARVLMAEFIRQPQLMQQVINEVNDQEQGLPLFLKQADASGALRINNLKVAETQFWGLCKSFAFWPVMFQLHDYSGEREAIIKSNVTMFVQHYQKHSD
ncbi:TetR/AcrR family transcriptional regulator [Paraglaciecola sp.]|uniref:TetR/AcrR family transcriptional regulator n=1 Tax=Paraglaciecola sp. TaxID=1920173 RepID=UPI0030F46A02